MFKYLAATSVAALLAIGAAPASAALFVPPAGPLFIKFSNLEQISPTGSIKTFDAAGETNWGILQVSEVRTGQVQIPNVNIGTTSNVLFTGNGTRQITGIFYGAHLNSFDPVSGVLKSKDGFIDLYYDEAGGGGGAAGTMVDVGNSSLNTPGGRTALNQYTGFTDGIFLGRLAFSPGAVAGDNTTTIVGDSVNTLGPPNFATGQAQSYADVDLSAGGAWASLLDTDYFTTTVGTRDVKLKNSFNFLPSWSGAPDIIGASSDDPAQAFAVPEPGTLASLGLGLLGLGWVARRRRARG
jgi:hypothetical protein